MNRQKREKLRIAMNNITIAVDIIERTKDDESDCLDNMPENLQSSERYAAMENAIDHLEDALSSLEDAKADVEAAIG